MLVTREYELWKQKSKRARGEIGGESDSEIVSLVTPIKLDLPHPRALSKNDCLQMAHGLHLLNLCKENPLKVICARFSSKILMESCKDGESVQGDIYSEISEGKAKMFVPKQNSVFYNPVQVFNRDLRY